MDNNNNEMKSSVKLINVTDHAHIYKQKLRVVQQLC